MLLRYVLMILLYYTFDNLFLCIFDNKRDIKKFYY